MKKSILSGWTINRIVYLAMGILITGQSVMQKEWMGVLFGVFIASMGIFALGCAGGNCRVETMPTSKTGIQKINSRETEVKK